MAPPLKALLSPAAGPACWDHPGSGTKYVKRHMKTHEVQRCEDCGKCYGSKKQFRTHKQVHNKQKNNDKEVAIDDLLRLDLLPLI